MATTYTIIGPYENLVAYTQYFILTLMMRKKCYRVLSKRHLTHKPKFQLKYSSGN